MRKIIVASLLIFIFTLISFSSSSYAEQQESKTNIQLTNTQKAELAKLNEEILVKKKELIGKYVEFGIITPEKGAKIRAHMDDRFARMKENGFICYRMHCGHKGRHQLHNQQSKNDQN
ncbi:DUF2680 domain-containing protein [Peribacillus saganii]|uniref:DUF2680 domain-containing protein n=1 Tax=Peribacillus saganii TaxID=2303992 RepID=A0A372LK10_9BACI|nr:YckD family protein [Peribacillus saganii]RFU66356.1 DUF2680 domain-containing protein [Peribacillus saganii]